MATILQMTYSNAFLIWKLLYFQSRLSETCFQKFNHEYISIGSDNGWPLDMWRDKPSSATMIAKFTYAYMRHFASVSQRQ